MKKSSVIDMSILGGALFVDIPLWDTSSRKLRNTFLAFDTGATVTTISTDILTRLGYDVTVGKKHKITTGSGTAYVREVIVDKLKLGSETVDNVLVYAHDFPDESYITGVIGLNVLSLFDICLLFSKKQIELTRIARISYNL